VRRIGTYLELGMLFCRYFSPTLQIKVTKTRSLRPSDNIRMQRRNEDGKFAEKY
jgi:hypothetical protein